MARARRTRFVPLPPVRIEPMAIDHLPNRKQIELGERQGVERRETATLGGSADRAVDPQGEPRNVALSRPVSSASTRSRSVSSPSPTQTKSAGVRRKRSSGSRVGNGPPRMPAGPAQAPGTCGPPAPPDLGSRSSRRCRRARGDLLEPHAGDRRASLRPTGGHSRKRAPRAQRPRGVHREAQARRGARSTTAQGSLSVERAERRSQLVDPRRFESIGRSRPPQLALRMLPFHVSDEAHQDRADQTIVVGHLRAEPVRE